MKKSTFILSLLFSIISLSSYAQSDKKISIQGILKDNNGTAVEDGPQDLTFTLYDAATGGNDLWTETSTVDVSGGIYSHLLGSDTALNDGDFGQTLYLEVEVGSLVLSPRTEMTYAPYTISAAGVGLNGGSLGFDNNGDALVNKSLTVDVDLTVNGTLVANGNTTLNNLVVNGIVEADMRFDHKILIKDTDSGIRQLNDGKYVLFANNQDVLHIDADGHDGRVGIHQNDPQFSLHVGSFGNRYADGNGNTGRFDHSSGTTLLGGNGQDFDFTVAYFEGAVVSNNHFASVQSLNFSDIRIKKNFKISNAEKDLLVLNKIKVTDYDYIDETQNNGAKAKKVIAQELRKVYPTAVTLRRHIIPNVYERTENVAFQNGLLTITTEKLHDFVVGDEVNVSSPSKEYNFSEVLEVKDAHTFVIKTEEAAEQVFVYGKYVDDYHTVDYDAISMLNVSATQELYRMVQALQIENTSLRNENDILKTSNVSLDDRLNRLEKIVSISSAIGEHHASQK